MKIQGTKNGWETRYIIIDEETGEILDDAQGYGYKIFQKALSAWNYKHPPANLKKEYEDAIGIINANFDLFNDNLWILDDVHLLKEGHNLEKEFFNVIKEGGVELSKKLQYRVVEMVRQSPKFVKCMGRKSSPFNNREEL